MGQNSFITSGDVASGAGGASPFLVHVAVVNASSTQVATAIVTINDVGALACRYTVQAFVSS
jgi:hypothetical protein